MAIALLSENCWHSVDQKKASYIQTSSFSRLELNWLSKMVFDYVSISSQESQHRASYLWVPCTKGFHRQTKCLNCTGNPTTIDDAFFSIKMLLLWWICALAVGRCQTMRHNTLVWARRCVLRWLTQRVGKHSVEKRGPVLLQEDGEDCLADN